MAGRVVIIGGGVAGLACSLGLAKRGWKVTVIERDPGPEPDVGGDEAFTAWARRGVAQFHQPHGFSARSRNLLLARAPEVVERLEADGVEASNLFKLLAPPELWTEEDEAFTGFLVRRPAFELALRRTVEADGRIALRSPATAAGLLSAPDREDGALRVTGVRLDDGEELLADFVLDCGGRRSPVVRWLGDLGAALPVHEQDCATVYYTRHYRQTTECTMPLASILAVRERIDGGVMVGGFPGDRRCFGVMLATAPDDVELRALRHSWAWVAAASAIPSLQRWIDPSNAVPVNDVQVMGNHQNVRRHLVEGGRPLVLGLLPVGDSLCATNPAYGWGASMALTYAFAAVDSLSAAGEDAAAVAVHYDAAVGPEADGVYEESAAMDRLRLYEMRGEAPPAHDREAMERQRLIVDGVAAGALRDPVLGRAMLRRTNLIDRPDATLDDPDVRARAASTRDHLAAKRTGAPTVTRAALVRAIDAAAAAQPAAAAPAASAPSASAAQ